MKTCFSVNFITIDILLVLTKHMQLYNDKYKMKGAKNLNVKLLGL